MMSNFNEVQSRLNFVLESFADMGNEAADYKLSKEDPTNDLYVEPPLGIFEISKNFFNAIEIFNSEFTTFLSKNGLDKKENAAEIYTKVATKALGLSNLSTEKSETFVEIDTNLQSILETNKFVNEITIKKENKTENLQDINKIVESMDTQIASPLPKETIQQKEIETKKLNNASEIAMAELTKFQKKCRISINKC